MTSEILLDTARNVVERTVGLRLDPAQRYRLDYWLHHTAQQRGVADSDLVDEIAAEGPALQAVLDELTVQETSFFRDSAQFAAFRRDVVPTLHSPLTVWSAGCAGGHEPYSIAMVLAESGIASWRVVASDISSRALRQAQAARYEERQLAGLGEAERSRYLRRAGAQWEVVPELREKVTVFRHNLIRDPIPPQAAGAEVVFCRNVLIYFDRPGVLAALERIATTMDPRGWVFLGYSESLWQVSERFHLVRVGSAFAYRQPEPVLPDPTDLLPSERDGRAPAAGHRRGDRPPAGRTPRSRAGAGKPIGRRPRGTRTAPGPPYPLRPSSVPARRRNRRRRPDRRPPGDRRPRQDRDPTRRCESRAVTPSPPSPISSPRVRPASRPGTPRPRCRPCARWCTWIPTTRSPTSSWGSPSS